MTRMDANKIVEKLEMNPFGIAHLAYGLRLAGRDRQAAGQEAAILFNRLFKAPASQLGELTLAQRIFANWFICGYNAQSSKELPAIPKEVDLPTTTPSHYPAIRPGGGGTLPLPFLTNF